MNTLLAAVVTLILAVGLAFLVEYLDDRLRSPGAVADVAPDVPILGTLIAEDPATIGAQPTVVTRPASAMAAAYNGIRTQLGFARPGIDLRSLLVVGEPGSVGSAEVAANLAVAFAQAGSRTVVVDADFQEPRLHTLYRQPNDIGLVALLNDASLAPRQVGRPWPNLPGLVVIPVGATPRMADQLLQPDRLHRVLSALQAEADIVIVRGPSLPDAGEAAVLAAATDGALLIVHGRQTTRQHLAEIRRSFRLAGADLVGIAYVDGSDTATRIRSRIRSVYQPSPRRRESS
jgi:succinoglycan biosynthesis transport protein ExoP